MPTLLETYGMWVIILLLSFTADILGLPLDLNGNHNSCLYHGVVTFLKIVYYMISPIMLKEATMLLHITAAAAASHKYPVRDFV
eukprot:scaffold136951_cov73-Attheya_sp.AAC.3